MILITGGAGYLGSSLATALINRGHHVRIFDISKTKYIPDEAEYLMGDIRNINDLKQALDGVKAVFHLAFIQTPSDLPEYVQRSVNITGTELLLRECINKNLEKFVFISSIEVYGSKPTVPIKEENLLIPVGIYGAHKVECELLCNQYWRHQKVPCVIARLPLICGPGYYNHKAFLGLIDDIVSSKTIFLAKPGTIFADMIHLDDALSALLLILETKDIEGETFHFSAKKPATHLDIVRAAIQITGSKSNIVLLKPIIIKIILNFLLVIHYFKFPKEQVGYLLYDFICSNEKAVDILGYSPIYSVIDSIQTLVLGYLADREFIKNRKVGEPIIDQRK